MDDKTVKDKTAETETAADKTAAEGTVEDTAPETAAEDSAGSKESGDGKTEMTQEQYVAFLETELSKSINLANDCKTTAQRLRADFDNFKKRNATIALESRQQGAEAVIESLIPVLDNCERAKAMITEKSALEGFELIERHLREVFDKFGVSEIEVLGKDFDAKYMSAVMREENKDMVGKVLEVFTKGYMLNGKVLRYASVKVAF